MRYARRFGAFWYDFLVDGRLELFLGPIMVLGLVWTLLHVGLPEAFASVLLVVLVSAVGAGSLALSLRRR